MTVHKMSFCVTCTALRPDSKSIASDSTTMGGLNCIRKVTPHCQGKNVISQRRKIRGASDFNHL